MRASGALHFLRPVRNLLQRVQKQKAFPDNTEGYAADSKPIEANDRASPSHSPKTALVKAQGTRTVSFPEPRPDQVLLIFKAFRTANDDPIHGGVCV